MTSLEIAELTGKRHDHVIRDTKKLIDDGAINAPRFGVVEYEDAKGEMRPMYLLDFQATMTVITGYDAKRRSLVIDRWVKLETGEAQPALIQKPASLLPVDREFRAAVRMAKAAGLKGNQAILSANRLATDMTGTDCMQLLGITHLISEYQIQYFTPTYLGKKIGKSPKAVNRLLKDAGLQEGNRDHKNRLVWSPTEEGKKHCQLLDTGKKSSKGTPVLQIKWAESVLPMVATTN